MHLVKILIFKFELVIVCKVYTLFILYVSLAGPLIPNLDQTSQFNVFMNAEVQELVRFHNAN